MRTQRQVVDFSLRRRALLRDLYAGRVSVHEVCDASPYLKSAARYHGEQTEDRCPVCRRENVTYVHYIYGDELRQSAGQARPVAELSLLATTVSEFHVYVVEVCRGCGWNHLVEQYLLGRGDADATVAAPGLAAASGTGSPATAGPLDTRPARPAGAGGRGPVGDRGRGRTRMRRGATE